METTLHQQLKRSYAPDTAENEVSVDGFRIDAVDGGRLIEVQCASLGAIRDKIRTLCRSHDVTVVKPVVTRRRIVRHAERGGDVVSRRWSPKRGTLLDVFEDLVHFTSAFPHERLLLEVVEVEVDEHRVPRRRRRWRREGHSVVDRELVTMGPPHRFTRPEHLADLLPTFDAPFTTRELAEAGGFSMWLAQKAAYFLRETGAWTTVGKRGNAWLYARTEESREAA